MKSESGRVLVGNTIIEVTSNFEATLVNFYKYSGPPIDIFPFTLFLFTSLTFSTGVILIILHGLRPPR